MHPTIDELAGALTGTSQAAQPEPAPGAAADEVTLCVTGIACRFPPAAPILPGFSGRTS
jgi:hypothetical protein